jgi:hypothetical protein
VVRHKKRLPGTILIFLSSFLYFFLAYIGFRKQGIDPNEFEKRTGTIIDRGIDFRYNSKGGRSACFFLLLDNLPEQKLGVYRFSHQYDDLNSALNIGDRVTVFFINRPDSQEGVNIDLIQVEKNGKVVIDKRDYEQRERWPIYIGLFSGIFSVVLSRLYYKRIWFR